MTVNNNDKDRFRQAADELNPKAKDSSWNRLETLLENDNLQQENKTYKTKLRWLGLIGIAASLLFIGVSSFFALNPENLEHNPQLAYKIESVELSTENENQLYDIDKLSVLNDSKLWVNVVEGGPKLEARTN